MMRPSIKRKAVVVSHGGASGESSVQSKTDRLIAIFHDEIRGGLYRLQDRLPSERELTARYNVSRITIRRALASLMADGIIVRRQGAGVRLRRIPEVDATKGPAPVPVHVGFVLRSNRWYNPIFTAFVAAFKDSLRAGVRITVYLHNVLAPASYRHDGVDLLIVDGGFADEDMLEMSRRGFRVIMFNRVAERGNFVCTNNYLGGTLMIDYLARKGHRRIAVYPYHEQHGLRGDEMMERLRGMRKAAGRHRLDLIPVRPITPDTSGFHHAVQELLRRNTGVTAVATLTDYVALEFTNELESNGVKVPQEVSMIGYDDQLFATLLPMPLTTIRQPIAEMARFLARVANELPQHAKIRLRRQFAPQLIERASVRNIS